MNFLDELNKLDIEEWRERSLKKGKNDLKKALNAEHIGIDEMTSLFSEEAQSQEMLEQIAYRSQNITSKRFGMGIQLYTPVYLSNFCQNDCPYCGFRVENKDIKRLSQSPEQVEKEGRHLKDAGFRSLLLVAGDDPDVTIEYLEEVIGRLHRFIPSISLEIAPKTVEEYRILNKAGAEGVVIYQETYNNKLYREYHKAGDKADFEFRLTTPDRVAAAGFHRIGIGALLGLGDPVFEGLSLFAHARYLIKHFWKNQITISLPRIREANGAIPPPFKVSDRQFVQLICGLRIGLPDTGIMLSTRESPALRDGLIKLGITHMSAGSKTVPGGYLSPHNDGEQFSVEDKRTPEDVAMRLSALGYDPIWKDWEGILNDKV